MAEHDEIERRFWVRAIDAAVVQRSPGRLITQGYQDSLSPASPRVRVVDDREAYLAGKSGHGIRRGEEEIYTDLDTAMFLFTRSRHCVSKTRYSVTHAGQEWTVDFYDPPLSGIVIAEAEIPSSDARLEFPPWMLDAVEVTETLTTFDLAMLATDLRGMFDPPVEELVERLIQRVPRIVLTGGPGSGKTSVLERLRRELESELHFVPEIATIVIGEIGTHPPLTDPVGTRRYNRLLSRMQRHAEEFAEIQARSDGKRALLQDRGVVDNAAYLPNGILDLEHILGSDRHHEYRHYDLVVILGPPPREVYEAGLKTNAVRYETYEQALALSERIERAWNEHPNVQLIASSADFATKFDAVRSTVRTFLGA